MNAPPVYDAASIGEVLLRLSAAPGTRLSDADRLAVHIGGAEANALAGLAALGRRVHFTTALPDHALGHRAARHLRAVGVGDAGVLWEQAGRIGAYYVEPGAPPRTTEVVYDRAGSCAAAMGPEAAAALPDARITLLTGITPALSASCAALVSGLIAQRRAANTAFAFDVNYRARLWPHEQAAAVLEPMLGGAAVVFCKASDAALFGLTGEPGAIARRLGERFGVGWAVVSHGAGGVSGWDGARAWHQPALLVHIVDRLGAGDALAAGVLDGWLAGVSLGHALHTGAIMAALALAQAGDAVLTTRVEIERLRSETGEPGGIAR